MTTGLEVRQAATITGPGGVNSKTAKVKSGQSTTVDVLVQKPGTYSYFSPVDDDRKNGMKGVAVLSR
jgi:plastocyanin